MLVRLAYFALALAEVLVLFGSIIGLLVLAAGRIIRAVRNFKDEPEEIDSVHHFVERADFQPVPVERRRPPIREQT